MRTAREKGVPHINCGKLIVATSVQEDAMLAGIKQRAEANGVEGMRVLTAAEAIALEPNLVCTSALLSPSTGIVDSHGFMLALQGDAENAGAVPVFFSPVLGGRVGRAADRGRCRRRRPDDAALPAAGEFRRAACAGLARRMKECRAIACRRRITQRGTISLCPAGRRSRG